MKASILFVSTGNTARGVIAEAIANQQFGSDLQAWSAGLTPGTEVAPLAISTLKEQGIKVDGLRPKGCGDVKGQSFDLLITLCEEARNAAIPEVSGQPVRIHWPLPDPTSDPNPKDMFEGIFDTLLEAVGLVVYAPHPELKGRATEAGRQICRRFAPRAA